MPIEIGHVEAIFRYPVKSMSGERLEVADLGWHGLDGDRRLAFRRIDDRSGMPWLTASKLPALVLFTPHRREDGAQGDLPTHVRTPDGEETPVFGEDLAAEVGRRYGAPVQMMQLNHGIFDEASLSVIASDTVCEIGRLAGRSPDVRRFRPNVVVRLLRPVPFQEDEWLGGVAGHNLPCGGPNLGMTSLILKSAQPGATPPRHAKRASGTPGLCHTCMADPLPRALESSDKRGRKKMRRHEEVLGLRIMRKWRNLLQFDIAGAGVHIEQHPAVPDLALDMIVRHGALRGHLTFNVQ